MTWRDAIYRHPNIEQVCQTLDGGTPANPGDLAALVMDRLRELAVQIRRGNTDDWSQYWNEPHKQPPTPKHEDRCRDALLSDLQQRLPQGIDAQPEGQYANDKRADIRVSYGNFQVPVEIKKNMHRDLWSACKNQLIKLYTSAPDTDGYGIYLVFWFGKERTQPPPSGTRPANARRAKNTTRSDAVLRRSAQNLGLRDRRKPTELIATIAIRRFQSAGGSSNKARRGRLRRKPGISFHRARPRANCPSQRHSPLSRRGPCGCHSPK